LRANAVRPTSWTIVEGDGPLIAAAIHHGHAIRDEVAKRLTLGEAERLREEDPFTGSWTLVTGTRIVSEVSRFEVDLNRPREKAVYADPDDAWGLRLWKGELPRDLVVRSLAKYDAFYQAARQLFERVRRRFGRFVVLDLHAYNHRRDGPNRSAADPRTNPEVNVGTGTMKRDRWSSIVERFLRDLRSYDFLGRQLDVRENVRFRGGHFGRWTHASYPDTACVLSIEFKKFFMDEWTGEVDPEQLEAIRRALQSTVPGILDELRDAEPRV
jgi:N-formylglutamate deformylase